MKGRPFTFFLLSVQQVKNFFEKGLDNGEGLRYNKSVRRASKPNKKEDATMTKQEITARINELDKEQFFLMMKDMWDRRDYARDAELTREIQALQKLLED